MGEMRDSDWSRKFLLRSVWLPIHVASMTTRNFCSCVKILDMSVLILTFVNGFTIFLCAEQYLSKYKMASPNLVLRVRKGRDPASTS